jgi:hypothetical protein
MIILGVAFVPSGLPSYLLARMYRIEMKLLKARYMLPLCDAIVYGDYSYYHLITTACAYDVARMHKDGSFAGC